MCTTEVHEVRGGGVGSAATVASGPAAVTVTAPAVPPADGAPVTPPDGLLAGAAEAVPVTAPALAPGLASGAVRVRPLALDSWAVSVESAGEALGRAGAATCAASRVAVVTPAASSAAVSRHSPATARGVRGSPGRRGRRGRAGGPPLVSGWRGSPGMLAPPAALAVLVSLGSAELLVTPVLARTASRGRAPRRTGSSMNRQDAAATARVAATRSTARPGLTGPPAPPAAAVSTISG